MSIDLVVSGKVALSRITPESRSFFIGKASLKAAALFA